MRISGNISVDFREGEAPTIVDAERILAEIRGKHGVPDDAELTYITIDRGTNLRNPSKLTVMWTVERKTVTHSHGQHTEHTHTDYSTHQQPIDNEVIRT